MLHRIGARNGGFPTVNWWRTRRYGEKSAAIPFRIFSAASLSCEEHRGLRNRRNRETVPRQDALRCSARSGWISRDRDDSRGARCDLPPRSRNRRDGCEWAIQLPSSKVRDIAPSGTEGARLQPPPRHNLFGPFRKEDCPFDSADWRLIGPWHDKLVARS
jgi:hypothetical protein